MQEDSDPIAGCRIVDILTKLNLKQEFDLRLLDTFSTDDSELKCLVEKVNNSCLHFTVRAFFINVNNLDDEEVAFGGKFTELHLEFTDVVTSFNVIRFPQVFPCSLDLVVGSGNAHILKEVYSTLQAKRNLSISRLKLVGIQLDEEVESLKKLHKLNIHGLFLQGCEILMSRETAQIACNAKCVRVTSIAELEFFKLTNVKLLGSTFSDDEETSVVQDVIPRLNKILPELQSLKAIKICLHPSIEPDDYGPYRELLKACTKLPDLSHLNLHFECHDHGISQSELEAVAKVCPKLNHLIILTKDHRLEYSHGNISTTTPRSPSFS